jgi:hypothetical protein
MTGTAKAATAGQWRAVFAVDQQRRAGADRSHAGRVGPEGLGALVGQAVVGVGR